MPAQGWGLPLLLLYLNPVVLARRGLAGEGGISAAFVHYAAQDLRVKDSISWGVGASQGGTSLWGVETRRRGGVYAMTPATVNSEETIKTRGSQVFTSTSRSGRGGELGVVDHRPLEIEPLWREDVAAEEAVAGVGLRLEEGDEVSVDKLPAVPTAEEEEEQAREAIQKAEEELTLEFLSSVIEEKMLSQKFDVRVPYKEPQRPRALPVQLDLLTYYAKEALKARNVTEAIRIYQQCIEIDPYDGRAHIGLARIELRRRNVTGARDIYETALQFCNDNPFVLQAYGIFEQRGGNNRRAMDLFNMAIRVDDRHSAAWLAKAQLLWELGKKREARQAFQSAIKTNPKNEVLWQSWGVAEKRDGNFRVARKLLRQATEINPRNSFCWHAWAVMEQQLRNEDLAVDLFKNALKAFPNSSHTYQAWACLEKDRGNWELAFQLFRLGIEKRPWDGGAYQPYALALKERREVEQAIEVFQRGLRSDPYHCPLYQAFGMMLSELGRADAARAIFEQGTRLNPTDRHVHYIWHAWAMLEEKAGNLPTARAYFKRALERKGRSVPTLVALAQLEEMDGNIDACRELWERVVQIQPRAEMYWRQFEEMEWRLGNSERARRIDQRRLLMLGSSGRRNNGGGMMMNMPRLDTPSLSTTTTQQMQWMLDSLKSQGQEGKDKVQRLVDELTASVPTGPEDPTDPITDTQQIFSSMFHSPPTPGAGKKLGFASS